MKARVQATGAPVARERRDGGQIKLSTFIPLKIRKRGASKVVVRPDGQIEAAGKVTTPHDQSLLVALTRTFYRQKPLDDGVVSSGSEISHRDKLAVVEAFQPVLRGKGLRCPQRHFASQGALRANKSRKPSLAWSGRSSRSIRAWYWLPETMNRR
ncbi:hypothetical protein [Accumulibacter sp.]|uniref:hypothetical protein n=1 Tax=Accumulibacter sp. TaxID=2053492 RepID=UPI0025F93587|nr:hypothetical protein [Accumulibacter sp.]MCM8627643.1 hypothetical protein [Accumulibacter sp.]